MTKTRMMEIIKEEIHKFLKETSIVSRDVSQEIALDADEEDDDNIYRIKYDNNDEELMTIGEEKKSSKKEKK